MTKDFIHASVTVNLRNTTGVACHDGSGQSAHGLWTRSRYFVLWFSLNLYYILLPERPLKQSDRKGCYFQIFFLFFCLCFLLIITWYLVVIELICWHATTRVFANCVPRNCKQYYHDKCLVLSWQRRRQTLCDKHDNNFAWKKLSAKLHPPLKRTFCRRPEYFKV